MSDYFCSYIIVEHGAIKAYGEDVIMSDENVDGDFLQKVKDSIIIRHYKGNQEVNIVITALNRI